MLKGDGECNIVSRGHFRVAIFPWGSMPLPPVVMYHLKIDLKVKHVNI